MRICKPIRIVHIFRKHYLPRYMLKLMQTALIFFGALPKIWQRAAFSCQIAQNIVLW